MRVVLVLVVSLLLLLPIFPVTASSGPSAAADREHYASWAAPLGFFGDLVVRFTVDYGHANTCTVRLAAASFGGPGGVAYRMHAGNSGVTGWTGQAAQVHHDDVDTRVLLSNSGGSAVRFTLSGPMGGSHEVDMTVFSGRALGAQTDDPWPALAFEIGCDQPFAITNKQGSREALGFTQQNMDGTGASAMAFLAGASVNLGDRVSATFTAPHVTFTWLSYSNVWGTLGLETDDGSVAWDLEETTRGGHTGGAGTYTVTLDRLAVGVFDDLVGILSASGPIDDFDDLV